jgi:hypothetical protein
MYVPLSVSRSANVFHDDREMTSGPKLERLVSVKASRVVSPLELRSIRQKGCLDAKFKEENRGRKVG